MPQSVPFHFVDVFAREPLAGNPLALVPDADGLTDTRMRAIAREFNQSETTFLVRPTSERASVRLRSFTAAGVEVLGAGHNAMGAWIWLALSGSLPPDVHAFFQQIGDEVLPVEISRDPGDGSVRVTMDQSAPSFGEAVTDAAALADALGIPVTDLDPDESARVVSTGVGHLLVPVRTRGAVDAAAPDQRRLLEILLASGGEGCYVYSRDPLDSAGGSVAYARFFNPTVGIVEDPATGTAAGPLVARLVESGHVAEDTTAIVEQGVASGRPSSLAVTVSGTRVRLSGSGVIVASGQLHLDE